MSHWILNQGLLKLIKTLSFSYGITVVGLLFGVFIFPIIANRLGPEIYGRYLWLDGIGKYVLFGGALGIPLFASKEMSEFNNSSKLPSQLLTLNLISSIIAIIMGFIVVLMIRPSYINYYILFIPFLFFSAIDLDWYYRARLNYKRLFWRTVVSKSIVFLVILFTVINENHLDRYILTLSCVSILSFVMLYYRSGIKVRINPQIVQHLKPSAILALAQLSALIYVYVDIFMIDYLLGPQFVGIYGVSSRIVLLLSSICGVIQITYFTKLVSKNTTLEFKENIIVLGFLVTFVLSLLLFWFSDILVSLLFTDVYEESKRHLRVFAVLPILIYLNETFGKLRFMTEGKFRGYSFIMWVGAAANVSINLCLIPVFGVLGAIYSTLLTELLLLTLFIFRDETRADWFQNAGKIVLKGGLIYILLYIIKMHFQLQYIGYILDIGCIYYVIWLAREVVLRKKISIE